MKLVRARVVGATAFDDIELSFCDDDERPHPVTVVHGAGGTGKTTLLAALAMTRPGHIAVPHPRMAASPDSDPFIVCDWLPGVDDPDRPHPVRVATPNVKLPGDEEAEALRRREQTYFDRLARSSGWVFHTLSSVRWFSRQPIALSAPERSVARWDVRAAHSLDDASRADAARETKQALAYAALAAALGEANGQHDPDHALLGRAMRHAVDTLVNLAGFRYAGVDARSFEPRFESDAGQLVWFDQLPTRVRHLVAFAALPVRCLWAAYPGADPLDAEGVFAIDDVDLHQDERVRARLVEALELALPGAQWLLTTSSSLVAATAPHVLALRRGEADAAVEVYVGPAATTH